MNERTRKRLLAAAEAIHGPLREYEEREAAKRGLRVAETRCRLHFERSVASDLKRAAEHPSFETYATHWQGGTDPDYADFRARYPLAVPSKLGHFSYWWRGG